tara:strand:- start:7212 stop:7460 length:249 start_codon:yes stop_codon:yes gene_type:complete
MYKFIPYNEYLGKIDTIRLSLNIFLSLLIIFLVNIIIGLDIDSIVNEKVKLCNKYKKDKLYKRKNPLINTDIEGAWARFYML